MDNCEMNEALDGDARDSDGAAGELSAIPFNNEVIMDKLVQYISPYDISCCRQVCHSWRQVFSCTNSFLMNFTLRLWPTNLKDLLTGTGTGTGPGTDTTFLVTEISWKSLIFELPDYEEMWTPEEECGVQDILSQFDFEAVKEVTIKGCSLMYRNIFKSIITNSSNLTVLNLDWLLLITEPFTVTQSDVELNSASTKALPLTNIPCDHHHLNKLKKLSLNSSRKEFPTRRNDFTLSQNLKIIFCHVSKLQSLSLLRGFSSFERMKRSMKSFKEIITRNSTSLLHLFLDDEFFECLAYWPRLKGLKTFGVTVSSWADQKYQLKVYMKYLVGQLTEFQFQSPNSDSHTNIFDLNGDGLSPMLVEYGQNLEKLELRSRIKIDTFPEDVAFIQRLSQLKQLHFSGESPAHALLSYFTPGDELVAALPLHLEKLFLRGFNIRVPFILTQLSHLTELCLNECKIRMNLFLTAILKGRAQGGLVNLKVLELWDYQKSHGPNDYDFTGINHNNNENESEGTEASYAEQYGQSEPWNIANLKALEKLTLRRFENISDNVCIDGIQFLTSLKFLDLGFCECITQVGVNAVLSGCLYLQELYIDDELEFCPLLRHRDGRPVKIYGISCAPVIVGNFIHNLLERIVELSSGI